MEKWRHGKPHIPVLLQPRIPGQSGGRVRLAPYHQNAGSRRGNTVDAVFRVVRRPVLLVLSGVEKGIHDRQEENGSHQNRKFTISDQVSITNDQYVYKNIWGMGGSESLDGQFIKCGL